MDNKTHNLARYGIYATIFAAIIGAGVAFYIHNDSKNYKTENASSKSSKKVGNSAQVSIKKIQLTPVAFDIPSSFYIEFESGPHAKASNVTIIIDFGESEIQQCSFRPNDKSNMASSGDKYILKLKLKELVRNESFYIHCNLSVPVFKKILTSGENISIDSELTFASFKEQEEGGFTGPWSKFFSILAAIFIVYLFVVFIRLFNRKFNIDW